ncbi:MAG: acyl-CoA dehydrogenase family protein [Longimicrobiales bacterium]
MASVAGVSLDTRPVRAFLTSSHLDFAVRLRDNLMRELLDGLGVPADDASARSQARTLASGLGSRGWLSSIASDDLRAVALLREAVAYVSPLADAVVALQALSTAPLIGANAVTDDSGDGGRALRQHWIDRAIAGTAIGAFAMTEERAGSDVAAMTTRARRDGDEYVIDGSKTLISNAGLADFYTVFASTDGDKGSRGISCFLVPADTPGLRFVGAQVMSAAHPLGEIALENCRVPARHRVGAEGGGFKLGMAALDRLRPTVAAAACGMAARALDEAVAHATQRRQFGEPLAEFQLVKEKIARMATDLTAARLLVYRAAWEKDGGAERITMEAAMAKAFATEAAQRIVDDAVQIIGGRGVLADHPVDRLYRSVRALRIYEGTTEIQHLIIAGLIVKEAGE